jgi:thiamine kinase-like enzyme
MKQYSAVQSGEWSGGLQNEAVKICARINAVNTDGFAEMFEEEQSAEPYPLSVSLENWERLQNKFPEYTDSRLLKEMYNNFSEIELYSKKTAIPRTLCHGDCHPNNFLKKGSKLIICDWQNAGIGAGAGDIAFFISRGKDMGLKINRNALIKKYCGALLKYADIKVDTDDIHRNIAASEFLVSFRFWAEYLQNSNIERVINIYNSMKKNYDLVISK